MVETPRRGARPARRVYQVTEEGEKEYHGLLRDSLWEATAPPHPLLPALSQLPCTDRTEVIAALKARAHRLEADAMMLRRDIERIEAGSGDPRTAEPYHVAELARLMLGHSEAEHRWTLALVKRIESGDLDVWSDDAPGRASFNERQAERASNELDREES